MSIPHPTSEVAPAAGAVVMGTGIVSIALALDHRRALSLILLVIAAGVYLALGLLLAARMRRDSKRTRAEAGSPAALTAVAATAVLGVRLTGLGWDWLAAPLLAIATLLSVPLLESALADLATRTVGVAFMLTVSTESLAVLAAALAVGERAAWLLYAALAPFLLGLGLYLVVLRRFDFRQLLTGRGDHWVTGGALAISALAAARITLAARSLHDMDGLITTLRTLSVVLWALAMAWLPVLLALEASHRRPGYDVRRWATVFPLGMYATCSFDVDAAAHLAALTTFARIWVWVAFVVWLVVFGGMLRRAPGPARHHRPGSPPRSSRRRAHTS